MPRDSARLVERDGRELVCVGDPSGVQLLYGHPQRGMLVVEMSPRAAARALRFLLVWLVTVSVFGLRARLQARAVRRALVAQGAARAAGGR